MVSICPNCQIRYVAAPHSGDFVHACIGNSTISNEDVPIVGQWTDYTGSGFRSKQEVARAGGDNVLAGTEANIRGATFDPLTARGNRARTTRPRQILTYIENPGNNG